MANKLDRGRRARLSLRSLVRGWPWFYETSPVFRNEVLLRTIPNSIGYYTPPMGPWAVSLDAFDPKKNDSDGISLYREAFISPEELARINTHKAGVRVGKVHVNDFHKLGLSVLSTPDPSGPPGHVSIPEMMFVKKTAQTAIQVQNIKVLALKLSRVANANGIFVPAGMIDANLRSSVET